MNAIGRLSQDVAKNTELGRHTQNDATVVAHVVGDVGGQERATAELIRGLLEEGVNVRLITARSYLARHPRLNVMTLPLPLKPASLMFATFYVVASLVVAVRRQGKAFSAGPIVANVMDVVTVHFVATHYYRSVRIRRRRRSTFRHGLNEVVYSWLARVAERFTYRPSRSRLIVAVSEGARREVLEHFPEAVGLTAVIPNGVDLMAFKPDTAARHAVRAELGIPVAALTAIFVGGDWERKGLRYAIEALAHASDWRLLVLGDGNTETYALLADQIGVASRVTFLGYRSVPGLFMASADAFLLPTAYESFCLACFEAAACGLPLLITRVSGAEAIVSDGENGWFIERDARTIGRRLATLRSSSVRSRMSSSARESVSTYTWLANRQAYIQLFRAGGPPGRVTPRLT